MDELYTRKMHVSRASHLHLFAKPSHFRISLFLGHDKQCASFPFVASNVNVL